VQGLTRRGSVSTVRDGLLLTHGADGQPMLIVVGSDDWFSWLEGALTFAYASAEGHFTARKEQFRRGGWYWKAYGSANRRLYRVYLGKSEHLTLDRLSDGALLLMAHIRGAAPSKPSKPDRQAPRVASGKQKVENCALHERDCGPRKHFARWAAQHAIPALPATLVSRPRLTEWLHRATEHPVTLIAGPAGSGKTTVLAEWALQQRHVGVAVAWVGLEPGDDDGARFWYLVLTALEDVRPGVGSSGLALLHGNTGAASASVPTEAIVAVLLEEISTLEEPIYLILDDYHRISSPVIHDGMVTFAAHAPMWGHVVIASREELPFADGRLRAYGQVIELEAADLRFTDAEAGAFLAAQLHPHLNRAEIAELTSSTEGWVAGLQLAALALEFMPERERSTFVRAFVHGQFPALVDYLIEEVLQRQDRVVREFLLRSSILDRLCGSLCNTVTGMSGGQAMLERIERARLFLIPMDGARSWYRYHHLFAEVLRARVAREHPDLVPTLYDRAVRWHIHHNNAVEAVPYALASGNVELAATVIEQAAPLLERRGETSTLLTWLAALPDAVLCLHPQLTLLRARLLLVRGQVPDARASLQMAEKRLTVHNQLDGVACHPSPELEAQLLAVRSDLLLVENDFHGALTVASGVYSITEDVGVWRAVLLGAIGALYGMVGNVPQGLQAYREAEAASRALGDIGSLLENLFGQGSMLLVQGHLREAATAFRLAVDVAQAQPNGPPPVAAGSYWDLARVLYEWDERTVAESHLRESLRLTRRYGDHGLLARCYLIQGRLALAQGNRSGVDATLCQLQELAVVPQLRQTITRLAAAMAARLCLAVGDTRSAHDWALHSGLTIEDELTYQNEFGHLTLLRVLLARRRFGEALTFAERLLVNAEATGRIDKRIELSLLRAQAFYYTGANQEAREHLTQALALAEHGGYIRLFVDEGVWLAALMAAVAPLVPPGEDALAGRPSHRYLDRIRLALQSSSVTGGDKLATPLSEREMEVLRHVAAGLSDTEIARELVVERSTVKWHVRNIFQKLGARRRTQALAIGHERHLL
jgi:LuxR family transcriptional regulator, maltose regulon positive regulatory protein